jgi:protein-arginine kinase activator protein McsA
MVEDKKTKRHSGTCYDCRAPLELFEIDMQNSTKIMLCRNCGLFHYYKKDFIGNYKLRKASKIRENEQGSLESSDR